MKRLQIRAVSISSKWSSYNTDRFNTKLPLIDKLHHSCMYMCTLYNIVYPTYMNFMSTWFLVWESMKTKELGGYLYNCLCLESVQNCVLCILTCI